MSGKQDRRIFISYAHKDGGPLAERLQKDLTENGLDAWLDTQRLHGGDVWTKEIEQQIDQADTVLVLLSAGSYISDICRAEQLRSLRKCKCVIPVLSQVGIDVPLHMETMQCCNFSNPASYSNALKELLGDIQHNAGIVPDEKFLTTYNNAPGLPENFVSRREVLDTLRKELFVEGSSRNIVLNALQGMGGIGKTVLAQELCHDEMVQQAFPDGIFWIAIGKESQLDFASLVKSAPGLDRLLRSYEPEASCLSQYRHVLRTKAALVVLDDVWRASDVELFIAESPRSRVLITTRDASIGATCGARGFTADLLTESESRQVLAKSSGYAAEGLPPLAGAVIHECGHLPLALAMIGAQLKGKPLVAWNVVLDHLRENLAWVKTQFPEPHCTLFRAIRVSVDTLDRVARQRYFALAELLDDMTAVPAVQQMLWNVDEGEALETAEMLISFSLAQRDDDGIRLHDLQLDYVRAQYPDADALRLIHGALQLSYHVISADPKQFASQVVGRLLTHQTMPAVAEFAARLASGASRPWLRSLHPTLYPPGTSLIRTLSGHSAGVNGVAVSADGRCAVSASYDKTLKVWDVESGRELRTLSGHSDGVGGIAVSADGRRAISASSDHTLKVWDVESGRELQTLYGHPNIVSGVAVSADGRCAVSASYDRTLKVWDVESGRELRTLSGHSSVVEGVAMSADGRCAVSACEDNTLKVWEVESGNELRTLQGHSGMVTGVAVSADGRRAVSASEDTTLKVWDVESGSELHTLQGHSTSVAGVAVSADGRRAVSAARDNTLKVWEVESGRELHTLRGHYDWATGVAVSADGRRAVSTSDDKTLKVWNLESRSELHALQGHSDRVTGVAVSADGRRAVSASADKTLKVWDVESGRELRALQGHSVRVEGVAVSADGLRAVSASYDNTMKVWDLDSGRELCTLSGHPDWVQGVAVSADGQHAVSASGDHTLKVWDVESQRELRTLFGHSKGVNGVAVSTDGRCAVSASGDHTLKVWDVESRRELRTLRGHSSAVNGVAMSADGRRAVSASEDMTLKVWDVESGRELRTLRGHSKNVTGVAMSADGWRAVSASWDSSLKVWDVVSGALLATFTCDGEASCCAFATNTKIVGGDAGGYIYFLELVM